MSLSAVFGLDRILRRTRQFFSSAMTPLTRPAAAGEVDGLLECRDHGGELVVGGTKTCASSAVVPLPKITRSVILARRRVWADERKIAWECWQDHDLVFCTQVGTPLEPRALNRDLDKLRARAGLPGVRLHDLRHTVVSLLSLGTPTQIARHADIDATMTIHAHANMDNMRQVLDAIESEAG